MTSMARMGRTTYSVATQVIARILFVRAVRLFGMTVDPSVLRLKDVNDATELQLTCAATALENVTSAVMTLALSRTAFGREEELAKVSRARRGDKLALVQSGSLRGTNVATFVKDEASVVYTIPKAGCKDKAAYHCYGQFLDQAPAASGGSVRRNNTFSESVLVEGRSSAFSVCRSVCLPVCFSFSLSLLSLSITSLSLSPSLPFMWWGCLGLCLSI